jgi:hypothetical protein
VVQIKKQDSTSWQSCYLWAVRSGSNNTYLTGVNVSTETDDVCEGLEGPEGSNKCASLAFQAMAALGRKTGHTYASLVLPQPKA